MSPVARLLVALVTVYRRALSPLFGRHCRFHPTCSEYALEAIRRFGAWKGTGLALRRISRCHPWGAGGVDHVPDKRAA